MPRFQCASCGRHRPLAFLRTARPEPGEGQAPYPPIIVCVNRQACRNWNTLRVYGTAA